MLAGVHRLRIYRSFFSAIASIGCSTVFLHLTRSLNTTVAPLNLPFIRDIRTLAKTPVNSVTTASSASRWAVASAQISGIGASLPIAMLPFSPNDFNQLLDDALEIGHDRGLVGHEHVLLGSHLPHQPKLFTGDFGLVVD